jgi:hypothetical protein
MTDQPKSNWRDWARAVLRPRETGYLGKLHEDHVGTDEEQDEDLEEGESIDEAVRRRLDDYVTRKDER